MAIGGFWSTGTAEIVDLSGQNMTCPNVSHYLYDFGSVGTFLINKPIVCGGEINGVNSKTKHCYSYDIEVN